MVDTGRKFGADGFRASGTCCWLDGKRLLLNTTSIQNTNFLNAIEADGKACGTVGTAAGARSTVAAGAEGMAAAQVQIVD